MSSGPLGRTLYARCGNLTVEYELKRRQCTGRYQRAAACSAAAAECYDARVPLPGHAGVAPTGEVQRCSCAPKAQVRHFPSARPCLSRRMQAAAQGGAWAVRRPVAGATRLACAYRPVDCVVIDAAAEARAGHPVYASLEYPPYYGRPLARPCLAGRLRPGQAADVAAMPERQKPDTRAHTPWCLMKPQRPSATCQTL